MKIFKLYNDRPTFPKGNVIFHSYEVWRLETKNSKTTPNHLKHKLEGEIFFIEKLDMALEKNCKFVLIGSIIYDVKSFVFIKGL